jgi:hypothetical protein
MEQVIGHLVGRSKAQGSPSMQQNP